MSAHYHQGRYIVRVVEQGFGQSKEKGTPYFWIRVLPVEIYTTESETEPIGDGYERDIRLYITDKTAERVRRNLTQLGWDGEKWSDLDPESGDCHYLDGQEFVASCRHETYGDDTFERWDFPQPNGGIEHQAEPGLSRRLDALFGASGKGGSKAPPQPRTRQTLPAEPRRDVDPDLPF